VALLALAIICAASEPPAPRRLTPAAKLFQAVRTGDLPMLKASIAEGADVNGRETNGLPPLLDLLRTTTGPLNDTRRQCVAWLIANGAAVDPKDDLRRTPLIHAARHGDLEPSRLLAQAEAYVTTRDGLHESALFYAVESNRRDIVPYLAAHGDLVSLTVKERKVLEHR